ncbi:hypothetical protein R1flu_013476 [Riccia fluitans]|uniref:Uncharacterized protein n=1 Tax=Riccia fluitans TaxID=41844 RepID=A0ABD1YDM7_9MARC
MKETQQGGKHTSIGVKISIDSITGEAVAEPLTFTQPDKDTSVPVSSGVDVLGSTGGGEDERADKTSNTDKTSSDKDVPN